MKLHRKYSMTSRSDIPKAFASVEEYNKFYEHVHRKTQKEKLLEDARTACAWGRPDSESLGYSHSELISIIRRLANYIERSE